MGDEEFGAVELRGKQSLPGRRGLCYAPGSIIAMAVKHPFPSLLFRTFALCALCGLVSALPASGQFFNDYAEPPHGYWDAEVTDPMTEWLRKVEAGEVVIPEVEQSGRPLLERLLRDLGVPEASQVLVFSKTSLQRRPVKPDNPRAIYFNDDVYIGWMPGGRVEVSSMDPERGTIFYYQRDFDDGPELPLFYRDRVCIQCHAGSATNFIPGPMGKSVFPDASGQPTGTVKSFELAGHDVAFEDRWGGWYVSGDQGQLRHMGNAFAERQDGVPVIDRGKQPDPVSLEGYFGADKYPGPGSDILALLMLDHQINMHYRLTEAHYRVRQALYDRAETGPEGDPRSDLEAELQTATEMVVRYLFFCDEAPLGEEPVGRQSTFRQTFLAGRRPAADGRSLRDLKLEGHIFENRCSYMIYSNAFAGLPALLKESIFARMKRVLDPEAHEDGYSHLGAEEKRSITAILTDTLPEFRRSGTAAR